MPGRRIGTHSDERPTSFRKFRPGSIETADLACADRSEIAWIKKEHGAPGPAIPAQTEKSPPLVRTRKIRSLISRLQHERPAPSRPGSPLDARWNPEGARLMNHPITSRGSWRLCDGSYKHGILCIRTLAIGSPTHLVSSPRELLVTTALPYANGPLHLGHLLESIQADIWVRSLRLAGHRVSFVCADDAHGTPIMLKAASEGIQPEKLIESMQTAHKEDLGRFAISFDHYHSTHSDENRALVHKFYRDLEQGGHLLTRTIRQMYDPKIRLFLPDRYIRGTCPRCGAADQYGDSCEICGASYDPSDLVDPRSTLTGLPPEARETEHVFVKLENFRDVLLTFVHEGALDRGVRRKLDEWLDTGLRDWDITRDAPYFGFEIPGRKQFFYVWLDAPIGYLASFEHLARTRSDLDFDHYLKPGSPTELYHFIGKDIIYFHGLFWPALLAAAGFRLPTSLWVHGFLTVEGQKMSKSRGTFLTASEFAAAFPPEALRYYFALKLGAGVEDIDLSLDDLIHRFNGDLVGKLVNLAARSAPFLRHGASGRLAANLPEPALYESFRAQRATIVAAYEAREYASALRMILDLADRANQYFAGSTPWKLEQSDPERARAIATQTLNHFRLLIGYLKPVLPDLAHRVESWLDSPVTGWSELDTPLLDRSVAPYTPLLTRLTTRTGRPLSNPPSPPAEDPHVSEPKEMIDIDLFSRLDLRVARILSAERVDGSQKLIRLKISLGTEERTVFAGIQAHYAPEDLVGRLTVVVANLAPRKMRFGTSEAMVLAANDGATGPFLLAPDSGAEAGMVVR